jgi:hypothetical protein
MSLKIMAENTDKGIINIQLDNGEYKVLKEIVEKWGFKNRENALQFALSVLSDSQDTAIKNVVVDLMGNDADIQNTIISIIEKTDRKHARLLMGKLGIAVWTIAIIVVEALVFKIIK